MKDRESIQLERTEHLKILLLEKEEEIRILKISIDKFRSEDEKKKLAFQEAAAMRNKLQQALLEFEKYSKQEEEYEKKFVQVSQENVRMNMLLKQKENDEKTKDAMLRNYEG